MNIGALFKIALWLAPVLVFVFLYVSQTQETQKAEMKKEALEFDRDFAQMNAEIGGDKDKFWLEQKKIKETAIEYAKKIAEAEASKSKALNDEIEKELDAMTEGDFKKLRDEKSIH